MVLPFKYNFKAHLLLYELIERLGNLFNIIKEGFIYNMSLLSTNFLFHPPNMIFFIYFLT